MHRSFHAQLQNWIGPPPSAPPPAPPLPAQIGPLSPIPAQIGSPRQVLPATSLPRPPSLPSRRHPPPARPIQPGDGGGHRAGGVGAHPRAYPLLAAPALAAVLLPYFSARTATHATGSSLPFYVGTDPFLCFRRAFLILFFLAAGVEGIHSVFGEDEFVRCELGREQMAMRLAAIAVAALFLDGFSGVISDKICCSWGFTVGAGFQLKEFFIVSPVELLLGIVSVLLKIAASGGLLILHKVIWCSYFAAIAVEFASTAPGNLQCWCPVDFVKY